MLSAVILVQLGINLLVVLGLAAVLRERAASARASAAREERLEALATELCALGRDMSAGTLHPSEPEAPDQRQPVSPSPEPLAAPAEVAAAEAASVEPPPILPAPRLEIAAALLDSGAGVAAVAARTAIPEGELRVLQNLRRPAVERPRPRRRAAAASPGCGGRRPARGAGAGPAAGEL